MKRFSDFAEEEQALDGDKAKIEDIVNLQITITGHKIRSSRYAKNKSGDYLALQFELDGQKRICFTGSDVLIEQLKKYANEIPFETTIRKINRYYTLT